MIFRLPTTRDRIAVMGRTGSGKTQFSTWLLSHAPFDVQPFVIVDYKGDDLLNQIPRVEEIRLNEVPKRPGLYIVHPEPDDGAEVDSWLRKVWERERIGLYFDEAYMLPDRKAFRSILTQGRSKHIPAICVSQRPSWISRFVFTEADAFTIFHLNDAQDRSRVEQFLPPGVRLRDRLPPYHARYYDVKADNYFHVSPVPDASVILETFEERLAPKRRAV